ncbi:MAG: hypothetical protein M1358_07550 [Chloroflexi bacterium]|nr:hypothetical protein [Chloroflexota bacterium]
MDVLSLDELKTLLETREGPCISIFLPTHQVGTDAEQDRIRLKNLLREAEERLSSMGIRPLRIESVLEPAQRLLSDSLFWQYQSGGVAMFLSPDFSRHYHFPLGFEELVVVADRFHVKPLLPLLSIGGRFYILAVSGDQVRLLQGSREKVGEIKVKGMPESLADALKYDEAERQLQYHTDAPIQRMRRRVAIFHGHGVGTDDEKDNILRYFYQIDKALHTVLHEERAPLVLAGVEYLFPIYREANTYSHLLEEGIEGNPEEVSAEELHERALAILQPYFVKAQEEAVAKYEELSGSERVSTDIKEIVPAATYGRIDTLFVAVGFHQWGSFNPDTNEVILHSEFQPGDEDLLDLASVNTILNRGTVHAVQADEVPGGTPQAAVFRY